MSTEDKQILDVLNSIETIKNLLSNSNKVDITLVSDLHEAITEINQVVYGSNLISINKAAQYTDLVINGDIKVHNLLQEVNQWCELISEIVSKRSHLKNNLDREFYQIMDYINVIDYEDLLALATENLKLIRNNKEEEYQNLKQYYTFYTSFWGGLDLEAGNYGVLEQRMKTLKEHQKDFVWLYEHLGDYRSKMVLNGIIQNWLTFNRFILSNIKEYNFCDYYDLDIIECDENEVFVDIGAFTGDSAKSFIDTYHNYKKIYCYEITPDSVEKCKSTLADYENIDIRNKGVGTQNEIMYFYKFGSGGSSNMVKEDGDIPIDIVSIDNDILEKVTFIKMDIEGAEQKALMGCRRHIVEEHPKLAICTYHNNEDIWKIPRMIEEMDSSYRFYMRYNGHQIGPTEYVLFGL